MNETTLHLIAGGFHRCNPSWTKLPDQMDQCFKVYIPVRGQASLRMYNQNYSLRVGQVYFFSGFNLQGQSCARRMDVHWIHFTPRSLYLYYLLSHVSQIHTWTLESLAPWQRTWEQFGPYFTRPAQSLLYRIHALLLHLIADVVQQYNFSHMASVDPVFEQLRPAINYMDDHFLADPSLANIAQAAHLAPNYFHRKFSRTFQMTPYAYVLQKRMSHARQLLLGTPMAIRDIATQSGYDCPFHFSRTFKKHFGISPSDVRSANRP